MQKAPIEDTYQLICSAAKEKGIRESGFGQAGRSNSHVTKGASNINLRGSSIGIRLLVLGCYTERWLPMEMIDTGSSGLPNNSTNLHVVAILNRI